MRLEINYDSAPPPANIRKECKPPYWRLLQHQWAGRAHRRGFGVDVSPGDHQTTQSIPLAVCGTISGAPVTHPPPPLARPRPLVVFLAKPRPFYKDYSKLVLHGAGRGADLSDVDVGRGRTIHVAESAKYLGSIVHRDGSDRPDVLARIKSARGAFGCLRKCLFSRKDVTYEGKRKVYEGLVLAILFYSSECWCLRESELQELHSFHQDCVRTMCRISMWHVEQYSITNQELLDRLGLQTMDTYLARRQLQWYWSSFTSGMRMNQRQTALKDSALLRLQRIFLLPSVFWPRHGRPAAPRWVGRWAAGTARGAGGSLRPLFLAGPSLRCQVASGLIQWAERIWLVPKLKSGPSHVHVCAPRPRTATSLCVPRSATSDICDLADLRQR
jgi:hypothetical protein